MEKGYQPQDSAPPYPGPPLNYGGAMPPQPGMYPQPAQPAGYQTGAPLAPAMAVPSTIVTPVVVTPALYGVPGQTACPHCQQTVITKTEHTTGLLTWVACFGFSMFGCCCIPFCIDACKDVEHHCPSCHNVIYVYKRI
ncbi:cell death-inducing p53-target protein 1 homolog [Chelmon rostratus]|uniref:cell death-inducing p53-target protein 1 homolog n=1 Tax=Chelmon rostratus TaxID=109905 RepID=UPI001BEB3755|nr:cell death-inducing p53-target protein 1 homolog [Chelmon rostratus]XP_041813448.1 cell death-inducing p53-target protein 1 homolog [Chelmon rostratus]